MYSYMTIPPFHSGTIAAVVVSLCASACIGALAMISPELLVNFGTVAMLFATPVAVIVNTVMARRDATKAALRVAEVVKVVATTSKVTSGQLKEIHTLVNSNLTASMQSELVAHKASLVLMLEMVSLKEASAIVPSAELLLAVNIEKAKIAELGAQIADRLQQS